MNQNWDQTTWWQSNSGLMKIDEMSATHLEHATNWVWHHRHALDRFRRAEISEWGDAFTTVEPVTSSPLYARMNQRLSEISASPAVNPVDQLQEDMKVNDEDIETIKKRIAQEVIDYDGGCWEAKGQIISALESSRLAPLKDDLRIAVAAYRTGDELARIIDGWFPEESVDVDEFIRSAQLGEWWEAIPRHMDPRQLLVITNDGDSLSGVRRGPGTSLTPCYFKVGIGGGWRFRKIEDPLG